MKNLYGFDEQGFAADLLATGLSSRKIAKRVGISHTPICRWMNGDPPSVELYLAACQALRLPAKHFIGVDCEPGGYYFDTRALHRATRAARPVDNGMRAKWNKGQTKRTMMRTLVRVCQFLEIPPTEFFTARPR